MTDQKFLSSTRLNQISNQLILIYDGDPWYGRSIMNVLRATDKLHAFETPANNNHSIAELLSHMIDWRKFARRRLQGDNKFLPHQENSFEWRRYSNNKITAWKMLLQSLEKNHQELIATLTKNDDAILGKMVAGKPYNFDYLLTGIIHHDLYHLGQIAYIQKIQQDENHHFEYPKKEVLFSYESLSYQK